MAACRVALVRPITDDPDMRDALDAAVTTFFMSGITGHQVECAQARTLFHCAFWSEKSETRES